MIKRKIEPDNFSILLLVLSAEKVCISIGLEIEDSYSLICTEHQIASTMCSHCLLGQLHMLFLCHQLCFPTTLCGFEQNRAIRLRLGWGNERPVMLCSQLEYVLKINAVICDFRVYTPMLAAAGRIRSPPVPAIPPQYQPIIYIQASWGGEGWCEAVPQCCITSSTSSGDEESSDQYMKTRLH